MKADLHFRENKVLVVEVPNKPGQWLRVAQAMADEGVEVSHTYLVGQVDQNHVRVRRERLQQGEGDLRKNRPVLE